MVGPYIWPTLHIFLKLWTFVLQIMKYRVHLWCMLGFFSIINSAIATTANLRSVNENLAWFYFLILQPLVLKVTGAIFIFNLPSLHVGFTVKKYISDKMSFSYSPVIFQVLHYTPLCCFSCLLPSFFGKYNSHQFSSSINKKLNLMTSDRTHCMCLLCLDI